MWEIWQSEKFNFKDLSSTNIENWIKNWTFLIKPYANKILWVFSLFTTQLVSSEIHTKSIEITSNKNS